MIVSYNETLQRIYDRKSIKIHTKIYAHPAPESVRPESSPLYTNSPRSQGMYVKSSIV